MKHSPSVQTHQQEVSPARVLLDTPGMEMLERVLVSVLVYLLCNADDFFSYLLVGCHPCCLFGKVRLVVAE